MGLILDTCVVIASEVQGHTVRQMLDRMRQATQWDIELGLSVVTVAELMHGAYRAKTSAQQGRRLEFIDRLCIDLPVYPVTLEIARSVGRIEGQQAAQGFTIGFEDLAIGVTALQLGFDVATFNVRHFERIPGLKVVTF